MSTSCENEFKYCPICQLPLQAINISLTAHTTYCLSSWDGSELQECPEGVKCLNTNIFHYRDYCHMKLAKYRSSSNYVEPGVIVIPSPKKQAVRSPKKQTILTPRKRPKKSSNSDTLVLLHVTEPVNISESEHFYSSDSDSDFILPRKRVHRTLKYSDSDSSISNSNKVKKNNLRKPTKSVSDTKSVKRKQNSAKLGIINRSKSINTEQTILETSPKVETVLTEVKSVFSESSDLFSEDDTFFSIESLIDKKSEPTEIITNCVGTQSSNRTNLYQTYSCTSSSDIQEQFNETHCNGSDSNNSVGSICKLSNVQSASNESLMNKPLPKSSTSSCTNKSINGSDDKEKWKMLLRRMRTRNMPSDLKVDTDDSLTATSLSSSSSSVEIGRKQCPFYRRIPGTPFVVDAFQYGNIPEAKVYFLSHFHSDHYIGLRKSFSHPIYCSQITANLVRMKIRVEERWLNVLTLHQPQVIFGVEVTALDANHCPGSLMLLFRLKNGCNYLHVGDFRASPKMCSFPELKHINISKLFLDTTYCNKRYLFPTQEDIISRVVTIVRNQMLKHPKLLVACGSYLIGKEKVFLGIAEALDWKIWARVDKRKIFECLNDPRINSRLTIYGWDARVHVLPMNYINHKSLLEHAAEFNGFTHVIGFKPTGWELNSKSNEFRVDINSNCTIYGVPYSEHSSYSELRNFVKFIHPEEIVPTVNVGNPASRSKMNKIFQEWMHMSDDKVPVSHQNTVSRYFNKSK